MTDISSITAAEPLRLWANLTQAQAALDRARQAVPLAGAGAHGWARIGVYCTSAAEVDAIAAQWGVRPRWSGDGGHYIAEQTIGAAATEAVFYGKREAAEQGDAQIEVAA